MIRRLTTQIELLSDGLHALRNGSPEVTDEYLDRALSAFRQEVESLRDSDGEPAMIVGFDFGTTNTLISVVVGDRVIDVFDEEGRPHPVRRAVRRRRSHCRTRSQTCP